MCFLNNDFDKIYFCRFLGHFQPQQDKPALWELDSDQHYGMGRNGQTNVDEDGRLADYMNC